MQSNDNKSKSIDEICSRYSHDRVSDILRLHENLNIYKDIDAILDRILLESRLVGRANAGSIFLLDDNRLRFAYVQNDTLFKEDESNAALYMDFSLPVDEHSIVGYSALTGQTLSIDDAYALPADLPYAFNPDYDRRSGYRTRSILTIPIKAMDNRLVGVIQLINAMGENGVPGPFSDEAKLFAPLFANTAAMAIERGIMNREVVLRMVRTAELRDPMETGAHVQRVGAYSAEIYRTLAVAQGQTPREVLAGVDTIRLAAMLHDVGKVGISDLILKKPGKLDDQERAVMQLHTVYGARLFSNPRSDLERMSRDIALGHHEKWAGGGYPGRLANLMAEPVVMGEPLKGQEIPLEARITALADVFDALSCRRVYKEPWPDEKVLAYIEQESGQQFDPQVVNAFFNIYEVIKTIRDKYQEVA